MKFIRSVAWIAAVATYVLIALSGVMSASSSGLNCPDWPFCYSQTYYSGTYHTVFALAHLCIAATVGILVVLLMIGIIRQAHKDRVLFSLGMMTSMLLVVQIVPGW